MSDEFPFGRAVAITYLVAWASAVAGAAWMLVTGEEWAIALMAPSEFWFTVLAVMTARGSRLPDTATFALRPWQVAWHRFALGLELPRAVRRLRVAASGIPTRSHQVPPKLRRPSRPSQVTDQR
jgi:hypothetical protein